MVLSPSRLVYCKGGWKALSTSVSICSFLLRENKLEAHRGHEMFNLARASGHTAQVIERDLMLVLNVLPDNGTEVSDLTKELDILFKRLSYESSHIDHVITQYRELLLSWDRITAHPGFPLLNQLSSQRLIPIIEQWLLVPLTLKGPRPSLLPLHILDMAQESIIGPHIDNIEYSGRLIAVLSLLSDRVLRFVNSKDPQDSFDLLVPKNSFYLQKDTLRYGYTHEVLSFDASKSLFPSIFNNENNTSRRLAILFRDPPSPHG
jgi:hypothetical protein